MLTNRKQKLASKTPVVQGTKDYQYEIDPNAFWIASRHTSDEKDFVLCTDLYEDYKSWAEENQIGLSVDFDSKTFGRSVMRKWRSKPKRIDGKVVKHYFGFKIPKVGNTVTT